MSKVMVSLPDELLQQIDQEAQRRSTSRSALIAIAARRELARPDPEAMAAARARLEKLWERAGPFEAAELVRQERDSGN
jgi:predicted transcriptional regulator